MKITQSKVHTHIGARDVRPMVMERDDVRDYMSLSAIGIGLRPQEVEKMADMAMDAMATMAMDDQQGLITTAQIATPVQFLQAWLPGFIRTITMARKIDKLIGITTVGDWEDEEVVQGVLEPVGVATPYADIGNVPLSSWNVNFERRSVVRFEKGFQVSKLEGARAAKMRLDSMGEKRNSSALALEIQRNILGFFGYNGGANRTYGFLNDPNLPAYYTVAAGANGTTWAVKTFQEITADIRQAVAKLQTQSQDNVNPGEVETTLAVATTIYAYLSAVSVTGGVSVMSWIKDTYPKMRVESAPQLNGANGGANVFYLYAEAVDDGASDNSRVFDQLVPAKFITLGVEQRAKAIVEDFSMASAGSFLKRPYGTVRASGV